MALILKKDEFVSIDDRAISSYLNSVWDMFTAKQRGSCCGDMASLDMALNGIVAFTQWDKGVYTQKGFYNVMDTDDVFTIFDNVNQI